MAIERNIGPRDDAPKAMLQNPIFAEPSPNDPAVLLPLIVPDRPQQPSARIPKSTAALTAPIGNFRRDLGLLDHRFVLNRFFRILSQAGSHSWGSRALA